MVASALLGAWPETVTRWGREAISAYLVGLERRGLTVEQVIGAIDTWPAGSDFPPSAPNLAAAALRDPSAPTFVEAYRLIYGPDGILRAQPSVRRRFADDGERQRAYDQAALDRARGAHPLVCSFVIRYGIARLRDLPLDDPEHGDIRRRELEAAWDRHVEAMDGRDAAALAARMPRGELGRFDPLAVLGAGRAELVESTGGLEGS